MLIIQMNTYSSQMKNGVVHQINKFSNNKQIETVSLKVYTQNNVFAL